MNPAELMSTSPARSRLAYAIAWLPVAAVFAAALLVADRMPVGAALFAGFASALPAALLAIPAMRLARRLSRPDVSKARFFAIHAVAATVYSLAWLGVVIAEIALFAPPAALAEFLRAGAAWQGVFGVLAYAAVSGVAHTRAAVARQREHERTAARAETLRLSAELEALRARLEPHFLFNALQTIGALVAEQPARAHQALELLATLLRRRLDASRLDDDATLEEEMVDIREYCALERLRLGNRLVVEEELDPATLGLIVPQFTLQPLVENAIRHGIAPRMTPGRLHIASSCSGQSWTLAIDNDSAEAARLANDAEPGIGLPVVRERLRLRFGDRATLGVASSHDAGFRVSLTLPVDAEPHGTAIGDEAWGAT